ncbi:hypothetical protein F5148DRAFT_1368367 [Russula earlei]|uniref:Uncharacterized protein n=1 Tax=Russula earlei TaxID=71964 RepID=A0ACC0U7Z9_9AGAM|nr:hypothetical protein F5148DRAFT_1368367 [Russula earlei]
MNAIGQGFLQAIENLEESEVASAITKATDLAPTEPALPTYFHRLTDMANPLTMHLATNLLDYQGELSSTPEDYQRKVAKKATTEIEETWRIWKEKQVEQRVAAQESEIVKAT